MAGKSDPIYSQLERALNLLIEGSAKIDFLKTKLGRKITELDDEELARQTQNSVFVEEDLNVLALQEPDSSWRDRKNKAESMLTSLDACKLRCSNLQSRVRELINIKDTVLCQSMQEPNHQNRELLPGASRIENMIMELKMEATECCVCTEYVKKQQSIWSCTKCYNIFHLACAGKCMEATRKNGKWNCPFCRVYLDVILEGLRYTCFCGRVSEPKTFLNVTPHACGEKCIRGCNVSCHPGPCP